MVHGPRANFLWARGEKSLEPKKLVAGVDEPVEPGFGEPHVGKKYQPVLLVHVRNLRLQRGADGDDRRAFAAGVLLDALEQRVVDEPALGDVGDVHRRLHGQQEKRFQHGALFGIEIDRTRGPRLIERHRDFLERRNQAT